MHNSKEIVIQKFGGTSIGTPENVINIMKILSKQQTKQIVVLSAFAKVTDLLYLITDYIKKKEYDKSFEILLEIYNIHQKWMMELASSQYQNDKMNAQLELVIEQIRTIIQGIQIINEISENVEKRIIAFGEILSTSLFFILISESFDNISFLNAAEVIEKNENSVKVNQELLSEFLEDSDIIVTQGFICLENGRLSNLGRGGSDYTASLLGASVGASSINIWKDVDGVLTAPPKQFPDAELLDYISFSQIRALAKYGAKVLHIDTIIPAIEKGINVRILNTSNPDFKGTLISKTNTTKKFSISMIQNVSLIEIQRSEDEEYFSKIIKSLKNITINKFNLLEVISNIDSTQIFYSKSKEDSEYSIICIINPDLTYISEIISDFDYVYNAEDKTLKIFVSTILSENLLNLIYMKLKLSLKNG